MYRILRTDSNNKDFISLVKALDKDLALRDGDDHLFYAQFNTIDKLKYAIVLYDKNTPIGCGAIKEYSPQTMEIKRMFTIPSKRGEGIAGNILSELEKWTLELKFTKCILETGKKQPEAIGLYKKSGYKIIPNYGQYTGIENSVCFQKELNRIS